MRQRQVQAALGDRYDLTVVIPAADQFLERAEPLRQPDLADERPSAESAEGEQPAEQGQPGAHHECAWGTDGREKQEQQAGLAQGGK